MKPLLVTTGEPAGIGPDLCLELVGLNLPIVLLGSIAVLRERAEILEKSIHFVPYSFHEPFPTLKDTLVVYPLETKVPCVPGSPDIQNAPYVMQMLEIGVSACLRHQFQALVTAPVHKGLLNEAGYCFTGHTEFLANACGVSHVVMLLVSQEMRVALVTTHLPLRAVPDAITILRIKEIVRILVMGLQKDFGIKKPNIFIAGLNPHAGEGGHLGSEEETILIPAIQSLQKEGISVSGPYSADTLFTPKYLEKADAFLAMYHDQGLTVLKYSGFGNSVNVTLGLPIIRTSVDHGTAFELAGRRKASAESLKQAVFLAHQSYQYRQQGGVVSDRY